MNSANLYAGLLILAMGGAGPALAQDGVTAASSGTQASARSNAVTDRYLTSVETKLTGKLDTKNAVAGQPVTVKTTQTVRLADGTTLPIGANLIGHVTQVQARQKTGSGALLAMTFDRAELKGGLTINVRGVIREVAPPLKSDDIMAAAEAGPDPGGATTSGGVRGTGGMFQPPELPTKKANKSILGTVTADTQGTAGQTGGSAVAAGGETVSPAPRETALPGVMLSNSGSGNESGILTAPGKNITLDSGTEITLGVIAR
jgi:hypothetical protein